MKILNRFTGSVLFEFECESMKLCVEDAVSKGANLCGANLSGANLCGANLCGADLFGANLSGANLRGAKNIIRVGPTSDGYEVFAVPFNDTVYIKAGCRWFSIEEARKHWEDTRGGTDLGKERLMWCDFIEVEAKARNWI